MLYWGHWGPLGVPRNCPKPVVLWRIAAKHVHFPSDPPNESPQSRRHCRPPHCSSKACKLSSRETRTHRAHSLGDRALPDLAAAPVCRRISGQKVARLESNWSPETSGFGKKRRLVAGVVGLKRRVWGLLRCKLEQLAWFQGIWVCVVGPQTRSCGG